MIAVASSVVGFEILDSVDCKSPRSQGSPCLADLPVAGKQHGKLRFEHLLQGSVREQRTLSSAHCLHALVELCVPNTSFGSSWDALWRVKTSLALIRWFSSESVHSLHSGESLLAERTFVWFFMCVCAEVTGKMLLPAEGLLTDRANQLHREYGCKCGVPCPL